MLATPLDIIAIVLLGLGLTLATIGLYGSTKAALNRVTNAFAVECHALGIRVNTVAPGLIAVIQAQDPDVLIPTWLTLVQGHGDHTEKERWQPVGDE